MTAQAKSDRKCHPAFSRVEKLRIHTGKTWAEIADLLDVGVSALMMVKSGRRGLSDKVIYRLAQAEIAAGIEAPVTGQTTMAELQEKTSRLAVPPSALYSAEYRAKKIPQLEAALASARETLGYLHEAIASDEAELAALKAAEKRTRP